ncbi:MAG: hypothetical protein AAFU68_02740 [Pseudomonadota bacterium]
MADTELQALRDELQPQVNGEAQKRRGRPPKKPVVEAAPAPVAEQKPKPQPAKRSRATFERNERRRRDSEALDNDGYRMKLAVHPEIAAAAEAEGLDLRWENDEGYRVQQREQEDWSIVKAEGFEGRRVVGVKEGKEQHAVLMSKPKEWRAEDRARKQRRLDEQMGELRRGNAVGGGSGDGTPIQSTGAAYVPNSGIKIGVGE